MHAEQRQTRIADAIIAEIDQEAVTTKKLLDLVPEEKLTWRPHPKAMSLGQLAYHIAWLQGAVAELGEQDVVTPPDFGPPPEPATTGEVTKAFNESLAKAKEIVGATDDVRAMAEWKLEKDGATIMAIPRMAFWRSILLNHNYHHRGQLSTYLRTLDVSLPSIYGPSADTNPF